MTQRANVVSEQADPDWDTDPNTFSPEILQLMFSIWKPPRKMSALLLLAPHPLLPFWLLGLENNAHCTVPCWGAYTSA